MMNAVELTRELIAVESTNPGMGESDMERFILRYLHGTGAALASEEVFPGRNNVMATLTGEEAAPSLVFVCHMDTGSGRPGLDARSIRGRRRGWKDLRARSM